MQAFLDAAEAPKVNNAKAIIVPHAGITYCGNTEAHAFKYFNTKAKRVFILGPSHRFGFKGCALTKFDNWETPIGTLQVDTDVVKELTSNSKVTWANIPDFVEEGEHSLEMCTTWIALLAPSIKIIPIMVGIIDFETSLFYTNSFLARKYADALLPFFKDEDSSFVISSDFCHWGSDFEYTYLNKEWYSGNNYYQSIDKLDHLAMDSIATLDPQKYKEYSQKYKNTVYFNFLTL